jgi:hypothetical protein
MVLTKALHFGQGTALDASGEHSGNWQRSQRSLSLFACIYTAS